MKMHVPALLNVYASQDSTRSRVHLELTGQAQVQLALDEEHGGSQIELSLRDTRCLMHPDTIKVLDGLVHHVSVEPHGADVTIRVQCESKVPNPRVAFVEGLPYVVILELDRSSIRFNSSLGPIVVDPACGGKVLGARGPINLVEKHLNLRVAGALKKVLEDLGFNVMLTREGDFHVPAPARFALARRSSASLMITVSMGQSLNPGTRGSRTRYNPDKPIARELAIHVHNAIVEKLGTPDLGIASSRVAGAPCPWIGIEPVVLTNKLDEALMRSPTFVRRIAVGVANGLLRFARQGGTMP